VNQTHSRFTHAGRDCQLNVPDSALADAAAAYVAELAAWRSRRGLSKKALAERMAYDRTYVSHIENGNLAPSEDFTKRADEVLATGGALLQRWQALRASRAGGSGRTPAVASTRELRTVEFVAWLSDRSGRSFTDLYESVAAVADRHDAEPPGARLGREHSRSRVIRSHLADALDRYYGERPTGEGFYRADVGGQRVNLSVLTRETWTGASVPLASKAEQFVLDLADPLAAPDLDELGTDAAVARLGAIEAADTVLINNPIYRLTGVEFDKKHLVATVVPSDFASYALTADLLESELVDALMSSNGAGSEALPLRSRYLPTAAAALDLRSRISAGGPAALMAVARPATGERPADYLLLIQERSGRVANVVGKLAVIPKAFHQPIVDAHGERHLSTTLRRELEEELLGRDDLESLIVAGPRKAAPFHDEALSDPMAWLLGHGHEASRLECTAFGINMVTGNYEFACLIVIDDEEWWESYGATVETNWEALRLRCYSSLDTPALAHLVADPNWSNEGLFAYLEGLRRLGELDASGRTAVPPIEVEVS
jgi:transcriptional regulator with XRE-family HTH domain